MKEENLSISTLAFRMQKNPRTILRHIHEGRLPATRVGKSFEISFDDIVDYVGARRAEEIFKEPWSTLLARYSSRGITADQWESLLLGYELYSTLNKTFWSEKLKTDPVIWKSRINDFLNEVRNAEVPPDLDSDPLFDATPPEIRKIIEAATG